MSEDKNNAASVVVQLVPHEIVRRLTVAHATTGAVVKEADGTAVAESAFIHSLLVQSDGALVQAVVERAGTIRVINLTYYERQGHKVTISPTLEELLQLQAQAQARQQSAMPRIVR